MKVEKKRRMRKRKKGRVRANRSKGRYILGAKFRRVKWRALAATKGGQVQVQLGLAGCSFQGRAAESDGRVLLGVNVSCRGRTGLRNLHF